jgi:toxin-antitoxin system PIN domain toxin
MKHFDANVLIAWHREDHQHHDAIVRWATDLLESDEPFGASDLAWIACLRVCSSPRVFGVPSSLSLLFDYRRSVEGQLTYLPVRPGPRHAELFERLCRRHRATGNLVNDAYLAALAIEDGADLVSLDGDFGRFAGLRWIDPLVE